MKRRQQETRGEHSPACAVRRGHDYCSCEASLVERKVKVGCVCGNHWEELGIRDYHVEECQCVVPGDAEPAPDDSVRGGEHRYNLDRL